MPLNANFDQLIERDLDRFVRDSAREGARLIKANLRGARSGIKHASLPNRSSSPDEFPAYQYGDLYDSIDAQRIGLLTCGVGSFYAPPEAFKLEFFATANGGRKWLSRTLEDPAAQDAMTQRAWERRQK
jgi:hypothetical protein